ncbi:MAG: hypothetical protein HYV32_05830 [Candidatus Kerfeldbacteria bacterium]|nr:hypothetical protein [Candidatus Kerfeldbacteria bacterium]
MDRKMKKKNSPVTSWQWKTALASSLVFIAVLGVIVTRNISEQTNQTTAYPIYVADEWTRKHVHYSFSPTFEWPQVFPIYQMTYMEMTRSNTDPIVASVDSAFLNFPIEESDDGRITYRTDGAYIEFRGPDQSSMFEFQLFTPVKYLDYSDQKHLTNTEQESMIRQFIATHPELLIGKNYVLESTQNKTIVRVVVDGYYSYTTLTAEFYDGQLHRVSGRLVTAVTKIKTADYGTEKDIVDYLNFNPSFPIHGKNVHVDIHYLITGYRITEEGVQLQYALQDPKHVAQVLHIEWMFEEGAGEEKNEIIEGYMAALKLPAERAAEMAEVEQYRTHE